MKKYASLILIGAAILIGCDVTSTRAADPIPADKRDTISLDGTWRFKLEQAPPPPHFLGIDGHPIPIIEPATFEAFYQTDYREDSRWHNLGVPGNWEMAGFSPATYHQPDNASGFYRLKFHVPGRWRGQLVKINFDGVQNGCEIWCNGQPVPVDEPSGGRTNYHESGWTAWQADLTSAVKFGQQNLLALRVTKNTKSVDCDTGDFFFLGGVYRPVTLFAVPASHFADISVRTKLLPDDQAEVSVIVQVTNALPDNKVFMHLEGQPPMDGTPDGNGQVALTQVVSHPKLWSAEFPNLYGLSVDLDNSSGKVMEHWTHKIGIREVSIKDGIFCVNHIPVKLAGICRHDVYPTLGTAINEAVWRKDLTLMRSANINAVRTSHYPYGSRFYDLCDEMGFYVADEEPFCWVNGKDTNLTLAFAQRARETVARDKNHPCVVLWAVGNENTPGTNHDLAAQITRQMDPTRPRLISCQEANASGVTVEFDDRHYVTPKRIHDDEISSRRAKWPEIYLENPNTWEVRNGPDYGSLDLWGAVIQRTWDELWRDDHVVGTFLWEWQDRAVVDKCPTKYYDYFPKTGINIIKVKGLVDGFRNPRPDYYHVKMAQAPIAFDAKAVILTDGVVLAVTNRYSFTDLSLLRASWSLMRGSATVSRSTSQLTLPPRSRGEVRLSLPAKALAKADTLRLDLDHPGGWNVVTYEFPLKPISHPAPHVRAAGDILFPRFNLVTGKMIEEKGKWRRLERTTGELANLKVKRAGEPSGAMEMASLLATPLVEVQSLDADIHLGSGSETTGRLHAQFQNGELSYRIAWSGGKQDIYELGWIFRAPKGADRFSWDREAVWSYYPPDHIGRPNGVARPDSARVELTKVDRPDAFDFNSTKFNCNWASLTDARGRGLCVTFAPEQREHVRGGIEADGSCDLVVNRCYSPPRDISSSLVPDLYTSLKKGNKLEGKLRFSEAK